MRITSYGEQQPQGANLGGDTGTYAATTVVDANGHQTISLSDGLGRSRYTEAFTGTSGSYALYGTSYSTYDYLGDVTAVYGPAASGPAGASTTTQTTATYDLLGRKQTMTDADLGGTSGNAWAFYYDTNGNATATNDARHGAGGDSYSGYDGLNRQLWRNTTNSPTGAYVTYTYDQTSGHGSGVGRLTSESFTGGTTAQPLHGGYSDSYDARGQTTNVTLTTTEQATYPLQFAYNDAGQATSLTYSDGEVFAEGYNTYGWLNSALTTPSGGSPVNLLTGVSYTGTGGAAGHLSAANLGNGTYSYAASYDNDLRLSSMGLTNVALGTTLFNTQRGYDAVGNVTSVNTTLAAGTDTQAFCYDALNRLTWAGATGTPSCGGSLTPGTLTSAQYTATYSYDPLNRITGGSLGTLTFGDSAHLHGATASSASGETATYDAAGDMVCRAPTSATTCTGSSPTGAVMTYDTERRLTSWQNAPSNPTSQAWFLEDGEGHRVEQYTSGGSGAHTYYLPGNVEEVTPSGGLVKYYAAGGLALGENTATDASGISYLASDGLGSVSVALDPSGNVTASQLYSPYGGVRYSNGSMPTAKGFTGQYADAATGLDYYAARYYDAALGQFTSADTAGDGLNRYGYVKGNPETYSDPSGKRCYNGDGGVCGGTGGNGSGGSNPPQYCWLPNFCGPVPPTSGNGTGSGSGTNGSCSPSDCPPKPQPAPCANKQNQCSGPPVDQRKQEIHNAKNDAAQGLQWLQDLLSKLEAAYRWFKLSDWGSAFGFLSGILPGLDDLKSLTQQLIGVFQSQLAWSDSMWTAANVGKIQNQVGAIGAQLMLKAAGISTTLALGTLIPIPGLSSYFVTAAIGYWGSIETGVTADLAASQGTIANEQWSLLGY